MDDPRFATIDELRRDGSGGRSQAERLVVAYLDAVAADDRAPRPLNAIRRINPLAVEDAGAADRRPFDSRKPLHGIPLVLKDNIDMAGMPTTSGARAMAAAMPWRDAGVVRRLRDAGAILLAKTNLSEFSFEIRSRSSLAGDVLNPFDRDVTAGGSSGGAAAAVAAGFAVAAVGTDTGGSIRTPAAFNGLVGLRPTHGLVDSSGVAPLAPSTDTLGTLTRTVADAGCVLAVLTGRWPTDEPDTRGPDDLRGVTIGVLRQAFGTDARIIRTMESGLAMLADQGATIIDPAALPGAMLAFGGDHIVDWEFRPAFDTYLATNFRLGAPASVAAILESGDFLPDYLTTLSRRAGLGALNSDTYRQILVAHTALATALTELFQRDALDAIVYPTSVVVPTSLENPKGGWGPELAARSGRPALTLPAGQAESGIPIGLELLGHRFQEQALLRLAGALELSIGRRFRPVGS